MPDPATAAGIKREDTRRIKNKKCLVFFNFKIANFTNRFVQTIFSLSSGTNIIIFLKWNRTLQKVGITTCTFT
jgi:hypothetical protein